MFVCLSGFLRLPEYFGYKVEVGDTRSSFGVDLASTWQGFLRDE